MTANNKQHEILTANEHEEVNIRKEATQKHDINERRKASEVYISRHVDHAVTQTNSNLRFLLIYINPSDSKSNYSTTSNNTKLVHWLLMGGLLPLVQRGGDWAGYPSTASIPITGLLYDGPLLCGFNVAIKGLINPSCKSWALCEGDVLLLVCLVYRLKRVLVRQWLTSPAVLVVMPVEWLLVQSASGQHTDGSRCLLHRPSTTRWQ